MNRLLSLNALFLMLAVQFSWGQVPQTISYQGVLTDAIGNNVADGLYDLSFSLYDVGTGSSALWSENHTQVSIAKGIFGVILGGASTPNPIALPFDKQYWLGTTVGSDPEMAPRIKLAAVAYSLTAQSVIGLSNSFSSNDNVGIGTSPSAKLDVQNTAPGDKVLILRKSTGGTLAQFHEDGNSNGQLFLSDASGQTSVSISAVGSSTFNGGKFGIGTTPQAQFAVRNSQVGQGVAQFLNTAGSHLASVYEDGNGNGQVFVANNSGQTNVIISAVGTSTFNGGAVGIAATGTMPSILTVGQGAGNPISDGWSVYSSRRWKENVLTIDSALDKIRGLRGVKYDRKVDGKHDIGLIAEEVGQVIPEIVQYEENGVDAQSVDYARLVAVLIEAVKEQQTDIEDLQREVRMLSTRQ